jgi:hypothetical protein
VISRCHAQAEETNGSQFVTASMIALSSVALLPSGLARSDPWKTADGSTVEEGGVEERQARSARAALMAYGCRHMPKDRRHVERVRPSGQGWSKPLWWWAQLGSNQ